MHREQDYLYLGQQPLEDGCGFRAGHTRQGQVEHNHIGLKFLRLFNCLFSVFGFSTNFESSISLHKETQQTANVCVVVHDKDAVGHDRRRVAGVKAMTHTGNTVECAKPEQTSIFVCFTSFGAWPLTVSRSSVRVPYSLGCSRPLGAKPRTESQCGIQCDEPTSTAHACIRVWKTDCTLL